MKRYYQGHEGVYQRIQAEGHNCWGRIEFDQADMRSFLEQALEQTDLDERQNVRALVLGCGTGPLACVLSQRGYQVSGIDISPTAIEMAKQQARERELSINYKVSDLCKDPLGEREYELILDSHCLHCIVPEDDRRAALAAIRQALTPDGLFILETMMGTLNLPEASSDEQGIVWTPCGEEEPDFEPRVQRDGLWYTPQRLLRPTKAALDEELAAAGFSVIWSNEVSSDHTDENSDYQAICAMNHP